MISGSWISERDKQQNVVYELVDKYLNETNGPEQLKILSDIKGHISDPYFGSDCFDSKIPQFQLGTLPYSHLNKNLIKKVYLSENRALIRLFSKHLPIPKPTLFEDSNIPSYIHEIEHLKNAALIDFARRNAHLSQNDLENKIVMVQRQLRQHRRKKTEIDRIRTLYPTVSNSDFSVLMGEANEPFVPKKCSPELSKRLMSFSEKVTLLRRIVHRTDQKYLCSIFNEGLYGRETLLKLATPFRPAALSPGDVRQGDGNAICFGAEHGSIDPRATGGIEFTLDLNKINFGKNDSIHCAFYKQRDFGYRLDESITVDIGSIMKIEFNHTKPHHYGAACNVDCSYMRLKNSREGNDPSGRRYRDIAYYSEIPNYQLISYNMKKIDQILIMNFFRFLDNLDYDEYYDSNPAIVSEKARYQAEIYHAIAQLNDEELLIFLESVGKAITRSMEFNFYGAHLIDFNSLISINAAQGYRQDAFNLSLEDLLQELSSGEFTILNGALTKIPQMFSSYRFLDFLMSKTSNPYALDKLDELNLSCKRPPYFASGFMKSASTSSSSSSSSSCAYTSTTSSEVAVQPSVKTTRSGRVYHVSTSSSSTSFSAKRERALFVRKDKRPRQS